MVTISAPPTTASMLQLRDYQYEMYELSLRENIVVAMDTGSGKTHIALLLIRTEVDRSSAKIVWFLAPTVALSKQQHDLIETNLPDLRTRLLTGLDNVDRWSEQRIWDAVLKGIQVVVSTPAVLADALAHGFVDISDFSLLIFDEAHHCHGDHPASKIMRNFYHKRKTSDGRTSVPRILGLSASPVFRSKIEDLAEIEFNLDSRCVTPRVNRQQMLEYVHRPKLHTLTFGSIDFATHPITSQALLQLKKTCEHDARLGPLHLSYEPRLAGWRWLDTGAPVRSEVQKQLMKFFIKACHVYEELGAWATDHFIAESVKVLYSNDRLEDSMIVSGATSSDLARFLDQETFTNFQRKWSPGEAFATSQKVQTLLGFLSQQDRCRCTGLVFVKQRVIASVLCSLLSTHPSTADHLKCATFVGMSNNRSKKYGMAELIDLKAQWDTLAAFRAREKHLIIATDALEEGIDVSACNLVISFNPPQNLKSFIQRRGRARQQKSQFAFMLDASKEMSKIEKWQALEKHLIEAYQSEKRQIEVAKSIEATQEQVPGELRYAKASLTASDTLAHLHHFCSTLPREPYVDTRPRFAFQLEEGTDLILATVILPKTIGCSLQSFRSKQAWRTERAAAKDAAFQAYSGLFSAGLLNENLLPLSHTMEAEEQDLRGIPSMLDSPLQLNPWEMTPVHWYSSTVRQTILPDSLTDPKEQRTLSMSLTLPNGIPNIPPLDLFLSDNSTARIDIDTFQQKHPLSQERRDILQKTMHLLTRSCHSDYSNDDRMDFVGFFSPPVLSSGLPAWYDTHHGRVAAIQQYTSNALPRGFVRCQTSHGIPYRFHGWSQADGDKEGIAVECSPLAKRRNFHKKYELPTDPSCLRKELLPIEDCSVDLLPVDFAQFSLFIPSILQHIESCIIAHTLLNGPLNGIQVFDIQHVIRAITAPSVGWTSDYQENEFFGDTLLKYFTSVQLFNEHKTWHEGLLTRKRARLVSNENLARAAMGKGLEQYIMTETFRSKQKPLLIKDIMRLDQKGTRPLSQKLLADVVEALVGAIYLDSGWDQARYCANGFLSEVPIVAPKCVQHAASSSSAPEIAVSDAELIIRRGFKNKATLMEALTHASCGSNVLVESYQRLEYLGDAVLDMIVVGHLADRRKTHRMSQGQMTHTKAASVNAHFLGFLCLDLGISEQHIDICEKSFGAFESKHGTRKRYLWQSMRSHGSAITRARTECLKRYESLCTEIKLSLQDGTTYPWQQLARLNPEKFFSDLVESVVGAIFVDSDGNLEDCKHFIERLGLTSYLDRLISGEVDVTHPKALLAGSPNGQNTEMVVGEQDSDDKNEAVLYSCVVRLDGADIVHVRDCLSKEEATLRGSSEAASILRSK